MDTKQVLQNLNFKQREDNSGIGNNEVQILEQFHKENNFQDEKFISQFSVVGKVIDRYYPNLNLAVEVDEKHHKYQQIQDIIRENKIKEKLRCKFVRIKDGW